MKVNFFEPIIWGTPLIGVLAFYVAGGILRRNGSVALDLATLAVLSIPASFFLLYFEGKLLEFCDHAGFCSDSDIGIIRLMGTPFFAIPFYLVAAYLGMRKLSWKSMLGCRSS